MSIPINNEVLEWCEQNGVDIAAVVHHEMSKAFAARLRELNDELDDQLLRGKPR